MLRQMKAMAADLDVDGMDDDDGAAAFDDDDALPPFPRAMSACLSSGSV